jgi:hypothetical protein
VNSPQKPRVLRREDSTVVAHVGGVRADSSDNEMLELLAVWLAEVSAEAILSCAAVTEDLPRTGTAS